MRVPVLPLLIVLGAACNPILAPSDAGVQGSEDAGVDAGIGAGHQDAGTDAGLPEQDAGTDAGQLTVDAGPYPSTCPTSGLGAITPAGPCTFFTPAQAGANPAGVNADAGNFALEPPSGARGTLLVYLPASLSVPARQIPDPTDNFYNAAARAGYHVLALAYRNDSVLGITCKLSTAEATNACFEGTRKTIVTGVAAPGAPTALSSTILSDEGIVPRIDAALRFLAQSRPTGGWDQFLADPHASTPETRIAWDKLATAGHSQGGGHAAFLAQLYPVTKVIQFSSTCDLVDSLPAAWTSSTRAWATSPATRFEGLGNSTDPICPGHVAIWQNMGLSAANQHDDAVLCSGTSAHECTVMCTQNSARWASLLQ